jgi:hypothetical protein
MRAASALVPTPGAAGRRGVEKSLDAARMSACATVLNRTRESKIKAQPCSSL